MASTDVVVGKVLEKLLSTILDAIKHAEMYDHILESMESTLRTVTPHVEKMKQLDKVLSSPDESTNKLWNIIQGGASLVKKCKEETSGCSGCFKKPHYAKELAELDDALRRFCQIEIPIQIARDQKKILQKVDVLNEEVQGIGDQVEEVYTKVVETQDVVEAVSDKVEEIREEVKVVKQIDGGVKNIEKKAEEIKEEMKENTSVAKEIRDDVKVIQNNVLVVKGIHEEVRDMNVHVQDIHRRIQEGALVSNGIASLPPCAPPEPPEFTVGLEKHLEELKKVILKVGSSAVVLSAPGGCGKTTLATKLCQDEQVKGEFGDNIFFVTVSKVFNLKVIVQQLFLHKGRVTDFRSDEDAVRQLAQLLKQIGRPILLVLDDVCPGSDSILNKFKLQIPNYKILVTSRSTFPGFGATYKMETLSDEDSMSLFRNSVRLEDGKSPYVDEHVMVQVVKACKGFPLALTVVGKSLCGQPAAMWQNRVIEWSKGGSIFKSNEELLTRLKSSLDTVDHVVKECYMDLSSFPEGHMIPATALIDMWLELYDLNEHGVSSIANIYGLSNLNLLNIVNKRKDGGEYEGDYDDCFVMQHDLLREMINHLMESDPEEKRKRLFVQTSGNKCPTWWKEQKQQSINARLLSITTDEKFLSNWSNIQAPEVEVLVLNLRSKNCSLPKFLIKMDKLKVLIVTNYEAFPAEIKEFLILHYLSSLRRIRLEQILIPSNAFASVKFSSLLKMSLLKCNVTEAFGENTTDVSDNLPSLQEINIGHCNNLVKLPPGICEIVNLKKLSITFCQDLSTLPVEIGKLVKLELLGLRSCVKLLMLPGTIASLERLTILDISDCLSIQELPEQIGELSNLRKIYMTGCLNCQLPGSATKLVGLESVVCDKETAKIWEPVKDYFPKLKIQE